MIRPLRDVKPGTRSVLAVFGAVILLSALVWFLRRDPPVEPKSGDASLAVTRLRSPAIPHIPRKAPNAEKNAEPVGEPTSTKPKYETDINAGLWTSVPVDPSKPRLTFNLLGPDKKLSSQATQYAAVPKDKLGSVQAVVDEVFAEMTEITRRHAETDPLRDKPAENTYAFKIAPFPEEGRRVRREMRDKLGAVVGEQCADKLMETFLWTNYFGAFGEGEVLVTMKPTEGGRDPAHVEWELRHPETGKVRLSYRGAYQGWAEKFGNTLEFSE
jgi:hypothetical protein